MANGGGGIGDVLDRLKKADQNGQTSAGDVLAALEDRTIGVVIAAFGLIAALPIVGAIPGISIAIGALLLVAIGQDAIGRSGLWAPAFVRNRTIDDEKFDAAIEKVRPYTDWIDRRLRPRLSFLTDSDAARWLILLCAAVLALSMFPLALIPWGVQAPSMGIVALGLALMSRDGVMALIGYAFAATTAYVAAIFL